LNSAYGLPIQGSSADFAPRGICFCVFGSSEFPNTFEKKQDSQMQTQKNRRSASTEIKNSIFIADIKHP
jgi:heme O synthase-like polyprenyltransferase